VLKLEQFYRSRNRRFSSLRLEMIAVGLSRLILCLSFSHNFFILLLFIDDHFSSSMLKHKRKIRFCRSFLFKVLSLELSIMSEMGFHCQCCCCFVYRLLTTIYETLNVSLASRLCRDSECGKRIYVFSSGDRQGEKTGQKRDVLNQNSLASEDWNSSNVRLSINSFLLHRLWSSLYLHHTER